MQANDKITTGGKKLGTSHLLEENNPKTNEAANTERS